MIKILIVEDDPLFAVDIEMCVDELGYENLGVFDRAEDALSFLEKNAIDMLVCDIQLKGKLTGLDVAKWAGRNHVPVVFVTSFDDKTTFAKAKALAPCAYIIKPFKAGDLQRALEIASTQLSEQKPDALSEAIKAQQPLFIKHKNKLVKIDKDAILYIMSDGNYATFVTKANKYVVKRSLLQIATTLPGDTFVRIHRSFLVRFDAISGVYPESQEVSVGEERLPIGRAYKQDLMDRMEIL